jgi:Family of unknown function (DUF5681)
MTLPNEHEPDAKSGKRPKGDYVVGKYKPPVHTRWQPGQSANPGGRPKGRRNLKTELEEIVSKKITIRDGETERKYSLLGANLLAHGIKGAKGDARSFSLFMTNAQKMGLLEEGLAPAIENAISSDRGTTGLPLALANKSRPSDALFEHLDENLLSQTEQIELSRLAEVIDSADGDITALSTADFERVKHIVNKGRGKGITAH